MRIEFDLRALARLGNLYAAAGAQAPHAVRRGINRAGSKARTQMKRALTRQTGLKTGTIGRALKARRASFSALSYEIRSRGGDVSLKFFGARETRSGVSAAPWGKRSTFGGSFLKGGLFPARKALRMGGHAFARTGKGRLPIAKQRSGLFIPDEMISGASAAAFHAAGRTMADDIAGEMLAILAGHAPRGRV